MRNCFICGGTSKSVLKTIKMDIPDEYHLPKSYDVACCDSCGFCFADTAASADDYDHYYSNCNSYSGSPKNVSSGDMLLEKAGDIIAGNCGKDQRIVDMGCGAGGFVALMTGLGYKNVIGIDPSTESIANLKRLGCDGYVASIYDEPDSSLAGAVDCMFVMSVLEHLLNPQEALLNVAKYMRPGGRLFADVPDYSKLAGVETPIPDQFNQEHINYFALSSMKNLLGAAGFEAQECKSLRYSAARDKLASYSMFGVFVYTGKRLQEFEKDTQTKASIVEYLQRQDAASIERNEKIAALRESGESIAIFGVGAYTMSLWPDTDLPDCNIASFVDNNPLKQDTLFMGHKILPLSALTNFKGTFVICSMLYAEDIKEQIVSSGMENKIVML